MGVGENPEQIAITTEFLSAQLARELWDRGLIVSQTEATRRIHAVVSECIQYKV